MDNVNHAVCPYSYMPKSKYISPNISKRAMSSRIRVNANSKYGFGGYSFTFFLEMEES